MKVLTDRFVESARAEGVDRTEFQDAKVRGLALRVTAGGIKTWSLRYRRKVDSKRQRVTLGEYPALTLAKARDEAIKIMGAVAAGGDPAKERKRLGGARPRTFGELAKKYLESATKAKRSGFKDEQILKKDVLPELEGEPLTAVTRADITAILDSIVARGAPIQANRTFEIIRRVFNWAIEKGYMDATPMLRMKAPAKARSRDRVLSEDEIRVFWRQLDEAAMSPETARILRLCLVTGQRVSEVAGLKHDELKLELAEWHIPGERTKNGCPHIVPLSPFALDLLADASEASKGSAWLFPNPNATGSITPHAVAKAMKRSQDVFGFGAQATPHDLRRTCASNLAALGFSRVVQDKVLNHVAKDRSSIAGVYDRHAYAVEKRQALEAWGKRLATVLDERAQDGNILPFHRQPVAEAC